MTPLSALEEFLKASEKAFCEGSILQIELLLSDKFYFEMCVERGGHTWRLSGGKSEYLVAYKQLFNDGQTFSHWRYNVLECRNTLFGQVKATLFFSCVAHTPDNSDRDERHIETIECERSSYGLRLLKLKASPSEVGRPQ